MKKLLFISNSTKPTNAELNSNERVVIGNISKPSVEAGQKMGYKIYIGINRVNAKNIKSDYNVEFYFSSIYRSLFDFKSNYIAFKNLMKIIKDEKIDVIHCNTPIGGVLGRICGRINKVPTVIYTAHGFHFYNGASLVNRTIFKWVEMYLARYTDAIITMNNEDYEAAQKLKLRRKNSVFYIHGVGIDTAKFENININKEELRKKIGLESDDIVCITIGDIIQRKNISTAINSIAHVNNPKVKLIICGTGIELENMKLLANKLNIEDRVLFLGFRTDIKELLSISDIFLFTTYQEGLPRAMMEAMAAGLPCVASKVRGNIDLIKDNEGGFLLEPTDKIGFSKKIEILAENSKLRAEFSKYNIKIIKKFDIENIKCEIYDIYQKVLN